MATFKVNFSSDRHGNRMIETVTIPDGVPVVSIKFAIGSRLRCNGYPEAHDIIILRDQPAMMATECGGLPAEYDCIAAGY